MLNKIVDNDVSVITVKKKEEANKITVEIFTMKDTHCSSEET